MKRPITIPVWALLHEERIFVVVRRKHKLIDMYPQRAILEELRKESSLTQANDWIDHSYYENLVEQSEKAHKRIIEKYGAVVPSKQKDPNIPIKRHIVPYSNPQVRTLDINGT